MSYEVSLATVLQNKDKRVFDRLGRIKEKATSLLTYTHMKFPYYTPHDISHSEAVEENLNWLVPDKVKDTFNATEIFFLLIAAWLHDWGMVGESGEDPNVIRELHHIRTETYFEKFHDKLDLDEHEGRIIGKICKGHRKSNLDDPEYNDIIYGNDNKIRQRFLAALLRLADECDITHNRTPEIIYCSINPTGDAEKEFKKHLSITGIGQLNEKHKIYLSAIAWEPKGAKALREIVAKIQNELNGVKNILSQWDVPIDTIELNLDARGFIDKPIAFEVNKAKIVELLIGEHLYSRYDAAIRELTQNAIDSCKTREQLEEGFKGKVSLTKVGNEILVQDNGIGMGYFEAKQFLSMIGSSFYNSESFIELVKDKIYEPISQFGIGILSCFLISDRIVIETKKADQEPCKFTIGALYDDWKYEKGTLQVPGTIITLSLNDQGKHVNLRKSLNYYLIAPQIDIYFQDEGCAIEKFESSWSLESIEERYFRYNNDDWFDQRIVPKNLIDIATDEYNLLFGIKRSSFNHIVLFNHGIFVGYVNTRGLNFNYYICVDLKKNLVDLHVSREDVIQNDKWELFISQVFDKVFNCIKHDVCNNDDMKYVAFITNILSNELFRGNDEEMHLQRHPFLKSFFNNALFPICVNGQTYYKAFNEALGCCSTIYRCCSEQLQREMEFVKGISPELDIIYQPYEMPRVSAEGNSDDEDLLCWLIKRKSDKVQWRDFRDLMLDNAVVENKQYRDLLPKNIVIGTFTGSVKPVVVIKEKAIARRKQTTSARLGYQSKISLWTDFLEDEAEAENLRLHSDLADGNVASFERHIALVDRKDDFVSEVLNRCDTKELSKITKDKIYTYFKYVSYIPYALQDVTNTVLIFEIVNRLEQELAQVLDVKLKDNIFNRIYPFDLIYTYYDGQRFDKLINIL